MSTDETDTPGNPYRRTNSYGEWDNKFLSMFAGHRIADISRQLEQAEIDYAEAENNYTREQALHRCNVLKASIKSLTPPDEQDPV